MPRVERTHSHRSRSSPYSVAHRESNSILPTHKENSASPLLESIAPGLRSPSDDDLEMILYLLDRESGFRVRENFLAFQLEIDHQMRLTLHNWLYDVCSELGFSPVTWYLTMNYVDRYCSSKIVTRGRYQLIGVTALFIAMKFEEREPISYKSLVALTDNAYSPEDILLMESEILNQLDFNLTAPTPIDFISFLLNLCQPESRILHLSNYLAQLAALNYDLVKFRPSMISTACVSLALNYFGIEWGGELSSVLNYDTESPTFSRCLHLITQCWVSSSRETTSIFEKYSRPDFDEVAQLSPTKN